MGIFDFMKKKNDLSRKVQPNTPKVNTSGECLDRLTEEGELPCGWHYHNREFTEKINNEYRYFLNNWCNSRNKSPKEQYSALKSFVLYIEDVERLCRSKGECFEFWCNEILIGKEYREERRKELDFLTANFDKLQSDYDKKQQVTVEVVIDLLQMNNGILQADFWHLFDEVCQPKAKEIVYNLQNEGKIEKTKSGRSYTLHYKG